VPALTAGLLAAPPLVLPGAAVAALALGAHAAAVAGMVRRRRRPRLDWGLALALTGTACLLPAGSLGLGLAAGWLQGPRPALAYAVLALGGWVSLTIAGMLLKIVPFLTWHRSYARLAGRRPVPVLAELSWPAAEAVAYVGLSLGVATLAAAVAAGSVVGIRAATMLIALGALALGLALARVLSHLAVHPAEAPAVVPAAAADR
jgi:hypothetical protein